jgi:hypothetical protein
MPADRAAPALAQPPDGSWSAGDEGSSGGLSTDRPWPLVAAGVDWKAALLHPPAARSRPMPTADHGLLGRLDALLDLVTRRRCLFLGPGARLVRADALLAAEVTGLDPPPSGPTGPATSRDLDPGERPATDTGEPPAPAVPGRGGEEAVEFLRLLAQAVGLLRVRGSRVEATALCASWGRLDDGLRAGLVYAAWCQQPTLTG